MDSVDSKGSVTDIKISESSTYTIAEIVKNDEVTVDVIGFLTRRVLHNLSLSTLVRQHYYLELRL